MMMQLSSPSNSVFEFKKHFLLLSVILLQIVSCFLPFSSMVVVMGFGISSLRPPGIVSSSRGVWKSRSVLLLSSDSETTTSSETAEEKPKNPFGALPVKEGTISVTRSIISNDNDGGDDEATTSQSTTTTSFDLAYTLVRPMSLSSRQGAPIVVLHGGPSVPSNYLYPLAKHVPYRSILFFDQLGCGNSDEPSDLQYYSIDNAIDDLEALLKKLGVRRFHLYGQSFGGILAFEYLKRCAERKGGRDDYDIDDDEGCLSVILSSAPTCVQQVENEAQSLVDALDDPDKFRETHQCRTAEMPQPLNDAYAAAGTVWRGTTAISSYEAEAVAETASRMPSAMILRGEHDFVTEVCCEDWKNLFNSRSVRYRTLEGCSHHGLLENGPIYGDTVDSFFAEYD